VPSTDLGPLPRALRAKAARRAAPPDAATTGETDAQSVTSIRAHAERRRNRSMVVALGVAALGAAVGVGLVLRSRPSDDSQPEPTREPAGATTEPSAPQPDGSAAPRHRVRVQVLPPGAGVTVDGRAVQVQDGSIELEGEPGASFSVVASDGERSTEAKIIVTKDGEPSLSRIEVPSSSASARRPEGGKGEPRPKPSAAASTPTATASAAGTVVPSSGKPPAKEDW